MEESYNKLEEAKGNSSKLIDEQKNLDTNYKKLEFKEKQYDKTSLKYNQKIETLDQFVTATPFLSDYKEQIPQKIDIEEPEITKNVEEINNSNQYNEPNNKESQEEQKEEPRQEENALIDPQKENKFKIFFNKIKEKVKAVIGKITGKEISDKQAEEIANSREVQDGLNTVEDGNEVTQETLNNIDIEATKFRESLSTSNKTIEEIAEAAIQRYEDEQREINNKNISIPNGLEIG